MYIRQTKTRNSTTGEAYTTFRLVTSERIGKKVHQKTLLNLGRGFTLAQEKWQLLCTLCKTVAGQKKTNSRIYSGLDGHDALKQTLHIVFIGDIHGIDNLRPRKPIIFGEGNLVVVYGNNGSGKGQGTR